ncbi:hypothetical protein CVT24_006551, partial [Panaeolus cyanescens]
MPIDHSSIPLYPFPTLPSLNISPTSSLLSPDTLTPTLVNTIASTWLSKFSKALSDRDAGAVVGLIMHEGWWRDMLALTWDFRTFQGQQKIKKFLDDRIATGVVKVGDVRLDEEGGGARLERPADDIVWITLFIKFETDVGEGSGIVRLMPTLPPNADVDTFVWKAHTIFTNLEALHGHPERIGPLRSFAPNHGKWEGARHLEVDMKDPLNPSVDVNPDVLIIGAGQSGLEVAARLKAVGVKSLCVEKNERVGDNWRNRYDALCLHDPVWYDHMPYLPFPSTWPVYTPARKLANWLEFYADALELNIWTSSTITCLTQDEETKKWDVVIVRKKTTASGEVVEEERKMTVSHVVVAAGLGSGVPNTPKYPGMDTFKGQILHSTQHKKASDHAGKKVVIVGACTSGTSASSSLSYSLYLSSPLSSSSSLSLALFTSLTHSLPAHDIAADYQAHNIDVTLFQHGSGSTYIMSCTNGWLILFKNLYWESTPSSPAPSPDTADRINASFPHYMSVELNQRRVKAIAELDRELLEGLERVGFKTNLGLRDTGFGLLAWTKAGGYYLDTGASQLIIDGKIKLKSTGEIASFSPTGIVFDDGSTLDADVVVFATGLGSPQTLLSSLLPPSLSSRVTPIWGLDAEGEINGVWRDIGVQ